MSVDGFFSSFPSYSFKPLIFFFFLLWLLKYFVSHIYIYAYLYPSFYLFCCSVNKSCNSLCLNYCVIVRCALWGYMQSCQENPAKKTKKIEHPYIENTPNYPNLPKTDCLLLHSVPCTSHLNAALYSVIRHIPSTAYAFGYVWAQEMQSEKDYSVRWYLLFGEIFFS